MYIDMTHVPSLVSQIEESIGTIYNSIERDRKFKLLEMCDELNWDSIEEKVWTDVDLVRVISDWNSQRPLDFASYSTESIIGHHPYYVTEYPDFIKEKFWNIFNRKCDAITHMSVEAYRLLFRSHYIQPVRNRLQVLMSNPSEKLETQYTFVNLELEKKWLETVKSIVKTVVHDQIWSGEIVQKLKVYRHLLNCVTFIRPGTESIFLLSYPFLKKSFSQNDDFEKSLQYATKWYHHMKEIFPINTWISQYDESENFFYLLKPEDIQIIKTHKIEHATQKYEYLIECNHSLELSEKLQQLKTDIQRYNSW